MQSKKWSSKILKEAAKLVLLTLMVSVAVDWWRRPKEPAGFAGQTLHTLSGRDTRLSEFGKDRVAVLYFWGSWCGYCKRSSPTVEKLRAEGIPVLSIALSSGSDDEVRGYMRQHGLQFETVNDPQSRFSRQWNIAATPTTVLVKNGEMLQSTTGLSTYWGLRARIALFDLMY